MKKTKKRRTIRFFITITIVRIATKLVKLLGRNASHFPGWLANVLYPDFLGNMEKPEKTIYITGTNGKTTVSNLTADVLRDNGYDFVHNGSGSNLSEGVISALLQKSTFFGKAKSKLAVLEVDEKYSLHIYHYMNPDVICCTNLFRDSCKRNAHAEYIFDILNSQIPPTTKLILNGEDLISGHLAENNERVYFGINCENEFADSDNLIKDIVACPKCGTKLDFDYIRYNHIGRGRCPKCGFGSPDSFDYAVDSIDYENGRCKIKIGNETYDFKLLSDNITDIYNMIASVSILLEIGLEIDKIQASFEKIKVTEARYKAKKVGGKEVIKMVAKSQNPIADSRVFDFIRNEPGNKAVLFIPSDPIEEGISPEMFAWIYDVDMEFLNDPSIKQIILGGLRDQDTKLRCLLAGIPEEKLACTHVCEETSKLIDYDNVDKIYLVYNLHLPAIIDKICDDIIAHLEGGQK